MEFISLKEQFERYETEINSAIQRVLKSGQYILGEDVDTLEKSLAEYVGVKHCLGVSSGTDALMLALKALNVRPGDEVITVPYTWVSPIECICRFKAKPVFVDIDPKTCLMDVNQLEQAITTKTKAIIPVSLYGQMPDMSKINEIAKQYNIPVIEDGAQSFGAHQNGKKSGGVTTIGTTSFFPTKVFNAYGDGGAVFTNRDDLAEMMRALRVHGAPERYNHQYIGYNARIDTLQAAILNAKFPHFENELAARKQVAKFYNSELSPGYTVLDVLEGNDHNYALYVLRHPQRERILSYLKENDIPHAIYYPICIHLQPAYSYLGYKRGDFPGAERVADEVFSIPMHPFLSAEHQQEVVSILNAALMEEAII